MTVIQLIVQTFFPFMGLPFGGKNGMSFEEDAGGGHATVATSSDLGEFLPDNMKQSRCPFFGLTFDAQRKVFILTEGTNTCAIKKVTDANTLICLLKAKGHMPLWSGCPQNLSNPESEGVVSALRLSGAHVIIPSKFGSGAERRVSFEEWYHFCTL